MAENANIILQDKDQEQGRIEISPQVIEIILGIAASDVDGVYGMRGSFTNNLNAWFGRENHGKGVSVSVKDGSVSAEVYVYLDYGVSVPNVSLKIQEALKQQLRNMTDLKLAAVNVHVVGVVPKQTEERIDPDDFFNNNSESSSKQSTDSED